MLIKDEIDIIEYTLLKAREWADKIFILDNGSTDGTWELVQKMADDIIVPWKQDFQMYRNSLRGDIYNQFKDQAEEGDWWCYKMDSDEVYYENPRKILQAIPKRHHVVYKKSIDYVFTEQDAQDLDFSKPFSEIVDDFQHIRPKAYLEARFFRHRKKLDWPDGQYQPTHIGIVSPRTIQTRHYQFRSPQQMQARLDLRNSIPKDKRGKPFKHVKETRWQELIVLDKDIISDNPENYKDLPTYGKFREPFIKRSLKSLFHQLKIWP